MTKAHENEAKIDSLNVKLCDMSAKFEELEKQNTAQSASVSTSDSAIWSLENKLEDSINRQSFKKIIVKGIKDLAND